MSDCKNCKKPFEAKRSDQEFCNATCRGVFFRIKKARTLGMMTFEKGSPAVCSQCGKGASATGEPVLMASGLYPVFDSKLACRACAKEIDSEGLKRFLGMREVLKQDEDESAELGKIRSERVEVAKLFGEATDKTKMKADLLHDELIKDARHKAQLDPRVVSLKVSLLSAQRILEASQGACWTATKKLINMNPSERPKAQEAIKALRATIATQEAEVQELEKLVTGAACVAVMELLGELKPRVLPVAPSYVHPSQAREQERQQREANKGDRVQVGDRLVSEAELKKRGGSRFEML